MARRNPHANGAWTRKGGPQTGRRKPDVDDTEEQMAEVKHSVDYIIGYATGVDEDRKYIVERLRKLVDEGSFEALKAKGHGGTYSGGVEDTISNLLTVIEELEATITNLESEGEGEAE